MSEITVYVKSGCPFCIKLKDLLRKNKISFTEINVLEDEEGAKGAVQKDGRIPVPQVDIKGRVIYDYSTEENLVKEMKGLLD
ncbi:glutaredoxin [Candidatus Pacearchaeota archaeon]|nr:glutaredoxin [Candidatus Pacearchaeota archaeon]